MGSIPERRRNGTVNPHLSSGLEQAQEDCYLYNQAVGSYNTHLDNHRDRRSLQDLPFRESITAHDACAAALDGDPTAIDALLTYLIDQAHLDSQLRRNPRVYTIHIEAVEQLQLARDQLISTLEEILYHARESGD